MNFNETPKPFVPSQEQAPVPGIKRRSILRALFGLGAVAAGVATMDKILEKDLSKESNMESLRDLLNEMDQKKLDSVPAVETTANENILSSEGWYRLEKIIKENNIKVFSPDMKIKISQIQELYESSK
ncbi:MAG: hypothetical protein NTW35_01685 [Candidatus Nomurabacteria bacterium]|nr:hypothetical protein [Candidatus Nomurabacteria bacterium]